MKKIIFTSLFLVMLTSLCVNLPSNPFIEQEDIVQAGFSKVLSSRDMTLEVKYGADDIRAGRTLTFYLTLDNNQDYELSNVNVELYDNPCFDGTFSKAYSSIRADGSVSWSGKLSTKSSVTMDTVCPIRFKVSYDGRYFKSEDIAVLPEGEYMQMENEGTLSSVPISSTSTSSPLDVGVRFSESRPFLESQKYYMYFDYSNRGSGNFENVNVAFTPTGNANFACGGVSGNQISDLKFARGKAPMTTCSLDTNAVTTIDIQSFKISATYKYILDDFITIQVNV